MEMNGGEKVAERLIVTVYCKSASASWTDKGGFIKGTAGGAFVKEREKF